MLVGKEEENESFEPFPEKGPFTPLWERLQIAKTRFQDTELNSYVDEQLQKIKEGLQQISEAFHKIDEWRKDVVNQLEELIRKTNKFVESKDPRGDPSASSTVLNEYSVFPAIAEGINEICQQVASFLPQVFESWKKSIQKTNEVAAKDTNRGKGLKEEWDLNITKESIVRKWECMDEQLQSCFRCLSLFPEDSIVRKRDLIYWWIGEEFVKPRGEKTAEEVGEERFCELLKYDVINPIFNKGSNRINGLTLHPSIRTAWSNENRFFPFDSEGKPTTSSNECPSSRGCISSTEENQVVKISPSPNMDNLVSFFNLDVVNLNFEKGVNLKNLTVLQLGRWRSFPKHNTKSVNLTNFTECLLLLKNLRYLGLRDTYGIAELPDNICDLSSLTVLDLGACHDLERLPSTISKLKSLTHLDVSDCEVLKSLPFEVINLKLHVLKGLVIGNSIFNLTNLKQWDKLRKLSINFGKEVAIEEEELREVEHLSSLTTLTITWWVKSGKSLKTNLNWLPKGLEKLDLRCFPLKELPSGLKPKKLKNLKRLYLRGGKLQSLKDPEVEGHKWQVEILRLRFLNELEENFSTLSQLFPCLKYVDIYECTKIEPFSIDLGGLDKQLKSCLLCLYIFSSGFEISRRKLVYWWIGEGFVEPTDKKTAEQVGRDCFLKLIELGLIVSIPKEMSGFVAKCRPSLYIQSKVVSLARESKFFGFDSKPIRKCLTTFERVSFSLTLTDELGCVINLNVRNLSFYNDAISNINNLTVLDLGAWSDDTGSTRIENPDSFFKCLHLLKKLICLGLERVCGIKEIPDTISELSELRVLNLRSCFDLERLSNGVVQLRKLTHLDMSDTDQLQHIPMKLNDLEELQVVKGFRFTDSNLGGLSNLDKWENLQKLSINFGNKVAIEEEELHEVEHLRSLTTLTITWWVKSGKSLKTNLNWLPKGLEKLDLRCFPLKELPSGLKPKKLKNLKRLYLRGGKLQSLKGPEVEGHKWQVEILRLRYLNELKENCSTLSQLFPGLKYVDIYECTKIEPFSIDLGDLDKQLKSCLLCLSIFSSGFEISRRKLVYWWIGEGFVESTDEKTAEQVGRDCFLKLIERGLIVSIPKEMSGFVAACRPSPFIQSMLVSLARESEFDSKPIRKCLKKFSNDFNSVSFSLTDELGCIINLNVQNLRCNNDAISTNTIKNLTVLDLGAWSESTTIENPDSLFKCLHLLKKLICLGLERVRGIKEIPDTISELSELRVLNLRSCFDLERLSNGVVQLRKLTHLDISDTMHLRSFPKNLNDLEELQVMKGVRFPMNLARWEKLQKLSINSYTSIDESDLGGLKDLKSLRNLSIKSHFSHFDSRVPLRLLPPNLEKLELVEIRYLDIESRKIRVGSNFSNLKRLYLEDFWPSLKVFEGLMLGVQVLRLKNLWNLGMDWSEVRRIFPCLKYVTVVHCRGLRSFPGDKKGVWRKDSEKEGSS